MSHVVATHALLSQPKVSAPVVGHTAQLVEQKSLPAGQVICTHAPPLTPHPSSQVLARHAGPEQVVVWTPAVGQVRQAPPHDRCPAGHVTG